VRERNTRRYERERRTTINSYEPIAIAEAAASCG
jgi:hypothetical protein